MMYLMVGLCFCMAVFSAVQMQNAHRRGKGGLRIVWGLLALAFAVCFVISLVTVLG